MKNDDTSIKRGSKNLFADLGYANAEMHLLKAGLVTRIRDIISESNLTQADAATVTVHRVEMAGSESSF